MRPESFLTGTSLIVCMCQQQGDHDGIQERTEETCREGHGDYG